LAQGEQSWNRFEYDAANRLVKVKNDSGTTIQSFVYGATNQRLITQDGDEQSNNRTYYAWAGGNVVAEYNETNALPTSPQWSKSYIFAGARLLSTLTPSGQSSEAIQYHHPDHLGTRLITNANDTTVQEQVTLPFGTALDSESTGSTNRRFTSYDRSNATGLDYAVNRTYDAQQGRFTQVDPIRIKAVDFYNPQTLNMYNYCGNDPINHTDPDGLFWKALKKFFKAVFKILKLIVVAVIVALTVIALVKFGLAGILDLYIRLFIRNFVLTVFNSIIEEIKEHGFTFRSFFKGLFRGIGRFFKKGSGFYSYGNYCGPTNQNQNGGHAPIDLLDAACQAHDKAYRSKDNSQRLRGDRRLFLRALFSFLDPVGKLFAAFAIIIFGVLIIVRSIKQPSNNSQRDSRTINVSGTGNAPIGHTPRFGFTQTRKSFPVT
jgi:RHS repeat-associated protein